MPGGAGESRSKTGHTEAGSKTERLPVMAYYYTPDIKRTPGTRYQVQVSGIYTSVIPISVLKSRRFLRTGFSLILYCFFLEAFQRGVRLTKHNFTGVHSSQDLILSLKIELYMGFRVAHGSSWVLITIPAY